MTSTAVQVPASLLLAPDVSPSAKLVWITGRRRVGVSTETLVARTGLDRRTVNTALAQLVASGWCSAAGDFVAAEPSGDDQIVAIPVDLLADRRLGARAKLLYGSLQLLPAYCNGSGQFSYIVLGALTGADAKTDRKAVSELAAAGWVRITQRNQLAAVQFDLAHPFEGEVVMAQARLEDDGFTGEGIMHECLSLLVESDQYEKNARPGFLINPLTDELMELDRYYPHAAVAFEYNGPQHKGPTQKYPSKLQADRQRARDLMKQAICLNRGITLVVIEVQDLSLDGLRQKIGSLLLLRDLTGHEPLVTYLEAVCRKHRLSAQIHS